MASQGYFSHTSTERGVYSQVVEISKSDAHKRHKERLWLECQVLLIDDKMLAYFRIPSSDTSARFSEMMEVQRQAGLVLVHQILGVPKDRLFVLESINLSFDNDSLPTKSLPKLGEILCSVDSTKGQGVFTSRASISFTFYANEVLIGYGSAEVHLISAKIYDRLRMNKEEYASHTGQLQSFEQSYVYRQRFFVDQNDPILTDHPSDHVTAMGIVCAVERLVCSGFLGSDLMELSLEFYSYAETTTPSDVEFQPSGENHFTGMLTQSGVTRAGFSGLHSGVTQSESNSN